MIIPNKLKKGDTIGVVAPSNPIVGDNIEEIMKAKEIVEKDGYKFEDLGEDKMFTISATLPTLERDEYGKVLIGSLSNSVGRQ